AASNPASPAPAQDRASPARAATPSAPVSGGSGADAVPAAKPQDPAAAPAAVPDAADKSADKAKDKKEKPPLGWVAGQPLDPEELLVEWSDLSSRELLLVVDKLVASRLALVEASRLGVRLAPEAVEQHYADDRKRLEEQVAKSGKKRTLEEFIERELG